MYKALHRRDDINIQYVSIKKEEEASPALNMA